MGLDSWDWNWLREVVLMSQELIGKVVGTPRKIKMLLLHISCFAAKDVLAQYKMSDGQSCLHCSLAGYCLTLLGCSSA